MSEIINISDARKDLYNLVDKVSLEHEPTFIKGKRNNAVLLSLKDWEDIQETLFVSQNKDLSESLIKIASKPASEYSDKLDW